MLFSSDTPEYLQATTPHNSLTAEAPSAVAVPTTASDVAELVRAAAASGRELVVQATGHGAGAAVGDGSIILDTSRLSAVNIRGAERVAVVGSGAVWGDVNRAAEQQGLLGLAGSAPSVSVSGYTFGGGVGWLARSNGLASSALRRVTYVDGSGDIRVAAEDAADELDRDALWVFRGGGGVGIAVELEFDLADVPELFAGYLLWPADALDAVVGAWATATGAVGSGVASSISVLHLPPAPIFPEELRGRAAVHLAVATPSDPASASAMLDAVRAAAEPLVDTWGAADSARLAGIHLDPPVKVPAYGDARWFGSSTVDVAAAVLGSALAADSPIAMLELRHVGSGASSRSGALTAVPEPFLYHAVGAVQHPGDRERLDEAFARARAAAGDADTGRPLASWMEGAAQVPGALAPADLERASAIADRVDPQHRIRRARGLPG